MDKIKYCINEKLKNTKIKSLKIFNQDMCHLKELNFQIKVKLMTDFHSIYAYYIYAYKCYYSYTRLHKRIHKNL